MSVPRSPYFWTAILGVAVVVFAWVGRENYRPVIAGEDAPNYDVFTLAGEEVSLDDYRGRVVLLNIWATWCAPCKEEMPSMQRLYEELEGTDFEILAVSVDAPFGESDEFGRAGGNLETFTSDLGLTFQILHDPTGGIQRVYQATGVPESFVVGRDGVIYKKLAGPTDWDAPVNVELIRRLLDS